VRSPLSARMRATALHDVRVVRELAVLQAVVSCPVELMLGRSPDETSRVEVINELTTKIWRLEELCS
jgi:hypothetical protein